MEVVDENKRTMISSHPTIIKNNFSRSHYWMCVLVIGGEISKKASSVWINNCRIQKCDGGDELNWDYNLAILNFEHLIPVLIS